ncbi:hypothetical protein B0T11DRAFT_286015 [Plectosphaerella cucumerina]|uniref:Uncharacterized protein n=1 Tax=Plectosphaerella cucumerina TaxID=40658 RepID=A0A8K0TE31_9PEZI|nr:hypothetical protein B0T11DRAFT_286015 [Plectosphaerella cucumerina]
MMQSVWRFCQVMPKGWTGDIKQRHDHLHTPPSNTWLQAARQCFGGALYRLVNLHSAPGPCCVSVRVLEGGKREKKGSLGRSGVQIALRRWPVRGGRSGGRAVSQPCARVCVGAFARSRWRKDCGSLFMAGMCPSWRSEVAAAAGRWNVLMLIDNGRRTGGGCAVMSRAGAPGNRGERGMGRRGGGCVFSARVVASGMVLESCCWAARGCLDWTGGESGLIFVASG